MQFWTRLNSIAARQNVLEHSFYVRWSQGRLDRAELSLYAGQYAHAVRALAGASRSAAQLAPEPIRAQLDEHAREEERHIELWAQFADAVGAPEGAAPLAQTDACVRAWDDSERELLPTLAALYAIESAQPAISTTKAEGLREHYGVTDRAATAYFDEHAVRDVEHAEQARELIEARLAGADHEAMLEAAERVLAANWALLDGVEEAYAKAA